MSGWRALDELVRHEFVQAREEGKDPARLAELTQELESASTVAELEDLHQRILEVPVHGDFPFSEPDDLDEIKALRNGRSRRWDTPPADGALLDRLHGAWLGRAIGCALGKPVEWHMDELDGMPSWERQKAYLTAIAADEWPLRDYFPEHSPAEDAVGALICLPSTREHIAFMESDDDIRYTVLGQMLLRSHGADFSSESVARLWLRSLPYDFVFTAETQAYRNMVIGANELRDKHIPDSELAIDWQWISHHLNPYREWIGAQIRVDSYGYALPGDPAGAAELAYRDARVSHAKNGVYGAMMMAAMIAAAFTASTVDEVIEAGLAEIPATSRLYSEVREVIELCHRHGDRFENFEDVIRGIYDLLGHYNPVHTNNNAAVCVAALILSGGDFHRAVTFAVMAGWDTDCNGATVGSIVGAMIGAGQIPELWAGRLNDTMLSMVPDYHPIAISECARRSLEIVQALAVDTPLTDHSAAKDAVG